MKEFSGKRCAVAAEDRLCLSENTAFQSLGKGRETVLMSLDNGYLYTCNDTTKALLEAMDGRKNISELASDLEQLFDVDEARLLNDLMAIAGKLLEEGLIAFAEPEHARNS